MPHSLEPSQVDSLVKLIKERHQVYLNRQAGMNKPWTEDEILQTYRFPNMYRELDRVTQWIASNWRIPYRDDDDVWFAMAVARLNNWPDTLQEVGYPIPWNPQKFRRVLDGRKKRGVKVFTGAYIIATGGMASKSEYVASVLTNLWSKRKELRPRKSDRLEDFYQRILAQDGLGTFMAAQIVADTKYTSRLTNCSDWWSWAAQGPGSCRGLNRLLEIPLTTKLQPQVWLGLINQLREFVTPDLLKVGHPRPHAQDTQGFCCEFDKYERTRLGEGRPRSLYPGKG